MFSRRKFDSLPEPQRHKKAAELLRQYWELSDWLEMERVAPTPEALSNRYHQHLAEAGLTHREHRLLPSICRGDRAEGAPYLPIAIYLDGLRSAHNVGSIIRTLEAFRLGTLHLSDQVPGLENKSVQNTSMGAWQWISCEKSTSLDTLPAPLIVMETSEEAIPISQFTFPKRFTLALGNEEYGCSKALLARADALIEIPLCGQKNSLNVANAFAIAAARIREQHGES